MRRQENSVSVVGTMKGIALVGLFFLASCSHSGGKKSAQDTSFDLVGMWRSDIASLPDSVVKVQHDIGFTHSLLTLANTCLYPDGNTSRSREAHVRIDLTSGIIQVLENRLEVVSNKIASAVPGEKIPRECRSQVRMGSLHYKIHGDTLTLHDLEPGLTLKLRRIGN